MLPKRSRLNLTKDFSFVSSGKRLETANFRLVFKNGQNDHPLVGVALTKKSFRKASLRNRARRLSSEAIQRLYPRLKENLNLVIMPKSQILSQKVEDLTKELEGVRDLYQPD